MRARLLAAAVLVGLAASFTASAATYYIRYDTGSDSSSRAGGLTTPWKSVGYAASRVAPGDTVCIMNNAIYASGANIDGTGTPAPVRGTASAHITFRGCDSDGTPLTFTSNASSPSIPSAPRPLFWVHDSTKVGGSGIVFHINRGNTGGNPSIQYRDNVANVRPFYYDFIGIAVTATNTSHATPDECVYNQRSGFFSERSSRVSLSHSDIFCNGANGIGVALSQWTTVSNNLVHDNAHSVDTYQGSQASPSRRYCVYGSGASPIRAYDWDRLARDSTLPGDAALDNTKTQLPGGPPNGDPDISNPATARYTEVWMNNKYWNNYNDLTWRNSAAPVNADNCAAITDGNGTLMDRNDGSYEAGLGGTAPGDPNRGFSIGRYTLPWLFANNVIYSNGATGVGWYKHTGPADTLGNTLYWNNNRATNVGSRQGELHARDDFGPETAQNRMIGNLIYTKGVAVGSRGPSYCLATVDQIYQLPNIYKNNICYDENNVNNAKSTSAGGTGYGSLYVNTGSITRKTATATASGADTLRFTRNPAASDLLANNASFTGWKTFSKVVAVSQSSPSKTVIMQNPECDGKSASICYSTDGLYANSQGATALKAFDYADYSFMFTNSSKLTDTTSVDGYNGYEEIPDPTQTNTDGTPKHKKTDGTRDTAFDNTLNNQAGVLLTETPTSALQAGDVITFTTEIFVSCGTAIPISTSVKSVAVVSTDSTLIDVRLRNLSDPSPVNAAIASGTTCNISGNNALPIITGPTTTNIDPLFVDPMNVADNSLDGSTVPHVTPLGVGISAADFRVKTNSPALGITLAAGEFVSTDMLGVARSASNITAGAFQDPVATISDQGVTTVLP